jgi:hypothetical protein
MPHRVAESSRLATGSRRCDGLAGFMGIRIILSEVLEPENNFTGRTGR